jgi:hypothetical protein
MSTYKLVPWSEDLDLSDFYAAAAAKGFANNSSQRVMVDCFRNEREWQVWILYNGDRAVGSVAAHSLDCLPYAYRICARTCVLTDQLNGTYSNALRTRSVITEHQNPTSQFFIPACIAWAGLDKDLYITTHPSEVASQRRVHTIFGPLLEKKGLLEVAHIMEYRGHDQHFWRLDSRRFLEELDFYGRW